MLDRVLEAGCAAPSAHNRQPWRFLVLTRSDDKRLLASVMGAQLAADRARDGDQLADIQADVDRSRARLEGAPVVVVVCLTMAEMDTYPDPHRQSCETTMAVQSVAMAGQNILIAAASEGLGACWSCAPLFCPEVVAATFDLPKDWRPQGLITLGYPLSAVPAKPRKTPAEVAIVRR